MGLHLQIDYQSLKDKIGEHNIFRFYFGEFKIGAAYQSIFDKDDNPSTGFYINKGGSIIYNDLRTGEKLNAVSFVMKLLNLSYRDALKQIAVDFNIVEGKKSSDKKFRFKKKGPEHTKNKVEIEIATSGFTKKQLQYWEQYNITEKELVENDVYGITYAYINGKQILSKPECSFAYLVKNENNEEYLKLYSPYSEKIKWLSNVPLNVPFGIQTLPLKSNTLIITKGQKDRICLKKYFTDVIALQNESAAALTLTHIKALKKIYDVIYIWFDTDRPGIKAANYYKKHGFIPIFIGDNKKSIFQNIINAKKNKVKDPSDFIKKYGIENFEKYLKYLTIMK